MAIITQSAQSQSSSAINGQSTTYIKGIVLSQVAGAPDGVVDLQLQLALRDFYTMSNAWRADIGPSPVSLGVSVVELNPLDPFSVVLLVFNAWLYPGIGGSTNEPTPLRPLVRAVIGGSPAAPSHYSMRTPSTMQLYPIPDRAYGQVLYAAVSLKPAINTTILPDIATEQHLDGIVAGTLMRLYRMPGKPWTDKKSAVEYEKIYNREWRMAKDQANRGYGTCDTPFRFPAFAGPGSQRRGY